MRTSALRRCARVQQHKPPRGSVLRLRGPSGSGRTSRGVGDGSDPPASDALVVAWGHACFHTPVPSPRGSLPSIDPYGKVVTAMSRPATLVLGGLAAVAVIARALRAPFWTVILADFGSRVNLVERSV